MASGAKQRSPMDHKASHDSELRAPTLRKRPRGGQALPTPLWREDSLTTAAKLASASGTKQPTLAVVIPCYKVSRHIVDVIHRMGPEVTHIFVVDDCCPEQTSAVVQQHCRDPRVVVVQQPKNGGVGSATMRGYQEAIAYGADVILKIDGDGQMDPALIGRFVRPVMMGWADYTKGNRFFHPENLRGMPAVRQFGNAMLSLMTKFSSGYWDIVDPTNGFTCIHAKVARELPLHKISNRYFFESDILFRLGLMGAVVADVPMASVYGDEVSGLRIGRIVGPFARGHLRNFCKRLLYKYLLRDVNVGTLELLCGSVLTSFGTVFGCYSWYHSVDAAHVATSGTVMLAGMPIILGVQLLLSGVHFDIQTVPKKPLHPRL